MNITKLTQNPYFSLYQKKKRTFRSPIVSVKMGDRDHHMHDFRTLTPVLMFFQG